MFKFKACVEEVQPFSVIFHQTGVRCKLWVDHKMCSQGFEITANINDFEDMWREL